MLNSKYLPVKYILHCAVTLTNLMLSNLSKMLYLANFEFLRLSSLRYKFFGAFSAESYLGLVSKDDPFIDVRR